MSLVSLINYMHAMQCTQPEEVRHAHVSVYGLYREAFSGGLMANLRTNRKLYFSFKSIGAINPIQSLWLDFNIHNPLGISSHDK